jgi:hypothetical protein
VCGPCQGTPRRPDGVTVSSPEDPPYQERLDRISNLFGELVSHAEVVSQHRCPYRDRDDCCTAMFLCRNQQVADDGTDVFICGHEGTFDYRDAWQSHPRNHERMKRKIKAVRLEAMQRRAQEHPPGNRP